MRLAVRLLTASWTSVVALVTPPIAGAQVPVFLPGDRTQPVYSTERRNSAPHWLELPRQARIRTGDGVEISPLRNSAVSHENLKLGILVGALRNDGACLTDLSARLQYVDADWKPIGPPIPNEARVSQVEPGGLMPFRFQLRTIADSKVPPAAYLVIVEQDDKPIADPYTWNQWVSSKQASIDRSPCPLEDTRLETVITKRQPLREGFLLQGTTTLVQGGPVRADGIVLTAVLRDAKHEVLEVLVGTPTFNKKKLATGVLDLGTAVSFRLHTIMPLGKEVASVDLMVEMLPDARVVDAPDSPAYR